MADALERLTGAGVAVWLDDLSRERLESGSLAELVAHRHVTGVTTNPTIFQQSIASGETYQRQLADLAALDIPVGEAVRLVTAHDVRAACDVLGPVFTATSGADGVVSIEVDPGFAYDAERTVAEARLLSWLVDRPNVLIKIPATVECLPAISACLAEGISVNVTLIFSLERYRAVTEAFLDGLERAHAAGRPLDAINSVASFFVSRVDTEVDARLDTLGTRQAHALRGHAAIANARLAYEHHERIVATERWRRLAEHGARPQRPLWASTGVKDPAYDDTRYVMDLVAPGTVNTMPEATLAAVADHGQVRGDRVRAHYDEARHVFKSLAAVGVDIEDVVTQLESEGVAKFQKSWTALRSDIAAAMAMKGD